MQIAPVSRHLLDGVSKRVAEIQQRAPALGGQLALVRLHDPRLERAAAPDHRRQFRAAGGQRRALDGRKQVGVAQQTAFHHFRNARRKLPRRQRREQVRGDKDAAWLVKRPDQILAGPQIDTGLAADRAVHHREQRRRHLVAIDAAQIGRRGKSRQVPDHAAAHREGRAAAVQT